MVEDDVCAICLDDTSNCDIRTLACKHAFHTKCFAEWSKKTSVDDGNTTCPCCRCSFSDPFECYRSIQLIPGATEIVYIPFDFPVERKNNSRCVCLFGLVALVQVCIIYTQFTSCM